MLVTVSQYPPAGIYTANYELKLKNLRRGLIGAARALKVELLEDMGGPFVVSTACTVFRTKEDPSSTGCFEPEAREILLDVGRAANWWLPHFLPNWT